MKILGKNIDLSLPKQPDEPEYSNLSLTRIVRGIAGAMNRTFWAGVVLAVTVVAFTLISTLHFNASDNAIMSSREQGSIATCRLFNEIRTAAIKTKRDAARDLIAAARRVPVSQLDKLTLTEQERNYIASQTAVAKSDYPHRDCSSEGRKALNENPPPDNEKCVPDGKGLCKP